MAKGKKKTTEPQAELAQKKSESVLLEEVVNITARFVQDQEATKDEMEELGGRLSVRTYIPILEKTRLVMMIVFHFMSSNTETHEIRIAEMKKELFFKVLLGAYAMIDVHNEEFVNYDVYDVLYPLFYPFLMQYCYDDYQEVVEMIRDTLNVYNIDHITEVFKNVDYKSFETIASENEKLLKAFDNNKQVVADLRRIAELEEPTRKALGRNLEDMISQSAYLETMKPDEAKTLTKILDEALPEITTKAEEAIGQQE